MKPAAFDYQRVETADEAAAVLAQLGDEARILAGGQSLMAVLNMRLARPQRLLDISRSQALAGLRIDGPMLHVGAAVTQATLEWRPGLAQELPLLALAFPHISHFQIDRKATQGCAAASAACASRSSFNWSTWPRYVATASRSSATRASRAVASSTAF